MSNFVTTMEIKISVIRMFILFKQKKWVCNSQHTLLLLPSPNKCLQKEVTLLISQSCCVKCDFTIISSGCNFFKKCKFYINPGKMLDMFVFKQCVTCFNALICCISD